jgi:hypothetical protein
MPVYDPSQRGIEPPKEAKSHASFTQVVYVQDYFLKSDQAMEDARLRPTRATLGNLASVVHQLWLKVFTIMESKIVERVDTAFKEFSVWYNRYTVHPSMRSRHPYYSNQTMQVECMKRLEDIYRTISEGLQDKQFFFKIQEREKQGIPSRIKLVESAIYGERRTNPELPDVPEPKD